MTAKKVRVGPYVVTELDRGEFGWDDPTDAIGPPKPRVTTGHHGGTAVDHPAHYNVHPSGIECIEVVRHHNFNVGSAIKYCWRQGLKEGEPSVKDLKKAVWYLKDEIARLEKEEAAGREALVVHNVPLGYDVKLGTKKRFVLLVAPQVAMRPSRITTNSPMMGLFVIERLTMAGQDVIFGPPMDAHVFNPTAIMPELSCPTVSPTAPVVLICLYTGKVPRGYKRGKHFGFTMNIIGTPVPRKEDTQ